MGRPQHVFEEHVGEVQIRVEADSLAELFAEAGRALAELEQRGQFTATVVLDV